MKHLFNLTGLSRALLLASVSPAVFALTPGDSLYSQQWAMSYAGGQVCSIDQIKYPNCTKDNTLKYLTGVADADTNATQGWDYFVSSGQQVVVALLDTGIDTDHADLKPYLWKNTAETRPDGSCVSDGVDNDNNGYVDDCYGWDPKANKGITDGVVQNGSLVKAMNDPVGHGTQMAGTIVAAANGNGVVGVAGIASNVKIVTCSAWTAEQLSSISTVPLNSYVTAGIPANQIKCADYFAKLKDQGVNIVVANVSGGVSQNVKLTPSLTGVMSNAYLANTPEVIAALDKLKQRGVLVVTSMGNYLWDLDSQIDTVYSSASKALYPASFDMDNILTVAATDINQRFGGNTSWGRYTADVSAPGQDVLTTGSTYFYDFNNLNSCPNQTCTPALSDAYLPTSGTSPAAGYVSGLAALIKANSATANLSVGQLKRLIMTSGKKLDALAYTTASGNIIRVDSALNCSNKKLKRRHFPKTDSVVVTQGNSLTMEVLNYSCAGSNGEASLAVRNLLTNSTVFYLYDNGTGADKVAGDGIYSGSWTVPSSTTTYKLSYGTDSVTAKADVLYVNPKATYVDASLTGLVGSTGTWTLSSLNPLTENVPYRGASYYSSGSANASYTFKFSAPVTGSYTLYANWPINKTTATAGTPELSNLAQYEISTTAGTQTVSKSQRLQGGAWIELGTYNLTAGNNTVKVKQGVGASGILIADSIRIERNTN